MSYRWLIFWPRLQRLRTLQATAAWYRRRYSTWYRVTIWQWCHSILNDSRYFWKQYVSLPCMFQPISAYLNAAVACVLTELYTTTSVCSITIVHSLAPGWHPTLLSDDKPIIERLDNECSFQMKLLYKAIKNDWESFTRPTSNERCRTSNPQVQKPLHLGPVNYRQGFSVRLLGRTNRASRTLTLSLSLMRAFRSNSSILANEEVRSVFEINKTPITPTGMRVVIHIKPAAKRSYNTHDNEGFYIGPAVKDYWC